MPSKTKNISDKSPLNSDDGDVVDSTVVTSIEKMESQGSKQAYILFLSGPLVGKLHHLVEGGTVIGRSSDSTIPINDNRVSRHHVRITVFGESVTIEDMGSTNGTYINGKRMENTHLEDGDKIQISSNTIFKFALQDRTENIFHRELYKMAVIDPVTNIYNKRYFIDRLAEECSLARRSKQPFSLLMIDIDHFKSVNDTFGHLAGDMVLHQVAAHLKQLIRQEDIMARYGGEEFAIILRGANESNAKHLAERMRKSIESMKVDFENNIIPVTMSFGVATFDSSHIFESSEAFIQSADKCLYYSKEHGRNRVTSISELNPAA